MGFLSRACRALDGGTLLEPSREVLSKLREKHPEAPPPENLPEAAAPQHITAITIAKAINSFSRGSAGGPTRFRPEHLQDDPQTEIEGQIAPLRTQ